MSVTQQDGVQFVLLGVESEVGTIKGFGLSFPTKDMAQDFFHSIHEYLISPGTDRSLTVQFTSDPCNEGTARLDLCIMTGTWVREIEVNGISQTEVQQLVDALAHFRYYFLLAGYMTDDSFQPIPPEDYHLFKADLYKDRSRIFGAQDGRWPTMNPFAGN